jgi:hypothetical protein
MAPADDNGTGTDLYVHVVDLRGPTITNPVAALVTSDVTPALNATLQTPGNTLEVREGATVLATFPTSIPSGAISTSLPTLAEGEHTITMREVDGPYASDDVSRTITIDTIAPAGLSVAAPADGAVIGNDQPYITGTAGTAVGDAASISVTVRDAATNLVHQDAAVPVAADGTWQELSAALPANGGYTIDVSQSDAAGNVSTDTTGFSLAAGVPTVAITAPVSGATNDATVTVTGTISGASTISLSVTKDAEAPVVHPVTATGPTWSHDLTLTGDGSYAISASATNVAGAGASNSVVLVLDTLAAATPTITAPVGATPTTTPMASGAADPAATILLEIDGSPLLPAPVADGTGAWSFQLPALGQGAHSLTAQADDGAGNLSGVATSNFSIDTLAPTTPIITTPLDGSTLNAATITITGFGEAGATVSVREDATTIGTGLVAANGSWQATATLANGAHTIVAKQQDAALQQSADSAAVAFTIDPSSTLTKVTTPLHNSTHGSRTIEIAGTAKRNGTVQLATVDGAVASTLGGPVPVDGNGNWSRTVVLNDGTYAVRATETTDGVVSPDRHFRIRSGVPIITAPVQGAAVRSLFTVSGTALPGATITLRDGTTSLGSTAADGNGLWAMDVTRPDGTRTLIAYAGDDASRTPDSDTRTVLVDSVGPTTTVTPDADVMGTIIGTPTSVSGTATDARRIASITVTYRNVATGQVVNATGVSCTGCGTASSATYSHAPTLAPGMWAVSVVGTDELGNVGLASGARFIQVA